MRTVKTLVTLALSATLLTGCVGMNKGAIITINNQPITKTQYDKAFEAVTKNSMVKQLGVDFKNDPENIVNLLMKDRVVNELIVKSLLDQDIAKKKIKVSQEEVDKELKIIIDQVGSKEKFNELLKQNGISAAQFKRELEEQVKISKLVDELKVVNISDKDAEKYYKSNLDKFKYPERVKASHILVSANKDDIKEIIMSEQANKSLTAAEVDEKVKAEMGKRYDRAKKLLDEVKKDPTSFAKVARENSDDTVSAKQGGDLGYFAKEQMVDAFSKTAFAQKPSTISNIVVTPFGYHIIMVTDRQEAGVENFDKVKNDIKAFLANQEKVNILQRHVDKLKNEASIVFNDPDYNPEVIQKAIKEKALNNPALNPALNPANQSAKD